MRKFPVFLCDFFNDLTHPPTHSARPSTTRTRTRNLTQEEPDEGRRAKSHDRSRDLNARTYRHFAGIYTDILSRDLTHFSTHYFYILNILFIFILKLGVDIAGTRQASPHRIKYIIL